MYQAEIPIAYFLCVCVGRRKDQRGFMTGTVLSDGFQRHTPQHFLVWVFWLSSKLLSVNFSMILAFLSKLETTGCVTDQGHQCVLDNGSAEIIFYYWHWRLLTLAPHIQHSYQLCGIPVEGKPNWNIYLSSWRLVIVLKALHEPRAQSSFSSAGSNPCISSWETNTGISLLFDRRI